VKKLLIIKGLKLKVVDSSLNDIWSISVLNREIDLLQLK
jgi:hypothetical protein